MEKTRTVVEQPKLADKPGTPVDTVESPVRKGHGRNSAGVYAGARKIIVKAKLNCGDDYPECPRGRARSAGPDDSCRASHGRIGRRSPGNLVSAERPSAAFWPERNRKLCGLTQARRKLTKFSEDFGAANWEKRGSSSAVTSNAIIAPDGNQTADVITAVITTPVI